MRSWCAWSVAMLFVLAGCHSDAFVTPNPPLGPFSSGADEQLTFNTEQDYWPAWTADGAGILYAFVLPGVVPQHRCIGLLPAGGGSRIWQLCDDRATQRDSINGFTAYALGADGRLIYVEAEAPSGVQGAAPVHTALWLADSATPFQRRALLTVPTFAGTTPVSWLADLAWTGPATFIVLAQNLSLFAHCFGCAADDSLFFGAAVLRGTIGDAGATLQAVSGTDGATSYSLAENGASIVFTRRDDPHLFKVPSGGGTDTAVALVGGAGQLLGVSCRGSICVVADDPVILSSAILGTVVFPGIGIGPMELRAVTLSTGQVQVLRTTSGIVATPQVSPVSGDVVAQVGGGFGHLQTFSVSGSDLHLYQHLIP
jgi:hypothetical protein